MDAERIDEIRRQIEAGTYEASGRLYAAVERLACVLESRCPAPALRLTTDEWHARAERPADAGPGASNV